MTQTLAIILKFREDHTGQFEEMFRAEVLPLWEEFLAQGKFIEASLTPIEGGIPAPDGQRRYILHVEVPGWPSTRSSTNIQGSWNSSLGRRRSSRKSHLSGSARRC